MGAFLGTMLAMLLVLTMGYVWIFLADSNFAKVFLREDKMSSALVFLAAVFFTVLAAVLYGVVDGSNPAEVWLLKFVAALAFGFLVAVLRRILWRNIFLWLRRKPLPV